MIAPPEPARGRRRSVFSVLGWGSVALAVAMVGLTASGYGQDTVFIGGSGQPSVEVHLEALEQVGVAPAPQRRLLMPGERRTEIGRLTPLDAGSSLAAAPREAPGERPRLDVAATAPAAVPKPAPAEEIAAAAPTAPAVEEVPDLVPAAEPRAALAPAEPKAVPVVEPEPVPVPVAEPERAPVVEPAPEPEPRRVAALPRVVLPAAGGEVLRIEFSGSGTRLTPAAEESLRAVAAAVTEADGRLQLQAFAGGSGDSASGARRTSLSRALAVRSFLIEAGVRSTRVDVRALGTAADSGPAERVDVLYVAR